MLKIPKLSPIRGKPQQIAPPMPSSSVVAEYAKSGRSSCKKCSKTIAAKDLRVGLVSRDTRGFDMTRWHHLSCFPVGSGTVASPEAIKGFLELKSSDREALKALISDGALSKEEDTFGDEDAVEGSRERISKSSRVTKRDEGDSVDQEERNLKKTKMSTTPAEEVKLDISFSASEVKAKYKDATLLPKWKAFQTVIFLEREEGLHDSGKIAAFDFDGCLANTTVKRVGAAAWSLMYPSIPEKLQRLYSEGFKLVIFTNESNIDRWKNKRQVAVDSKIGRLNSFIKLVNVPIQVFIACGTGKSDGKDDPFRKPKTGMWHLMEQQFNSGITVDMDKSFYVGDAAGRPYDHSDADIKFAEAVGLKFYVPEDYFST